MMRNTFRSKPQVTSALHDNYQTTKKKPRAVYVDAQNAVDADELNVRNMKQVQNGEVQTWRFRVHKTIAKTEVCHVVARIWQMTFCIFAVE